MPNIFKRRVYYYAAYAVFAAIYILFSLLAPLGPNRYNLTPNKTHLLQLTILLPVVLIWLAAIFGAERFHHYSLSIRRSKDGEAMNQVSVGLLFLVGSILIGGLVSLVRPWALKDHWLAAFTIFSNYINAFLPFISFAVIYAGTLKMLKLTKRPAPWTDWAIVALITVLIAVVYLLKLLNYDYLTSTPDPYKYSSFYMSSPLIILTLALPYIFGWALAIKAALNLNHYRRQISGIIYKKSLLRLEVGFLIVTVFFIVVQLFFAFSTYIAKAGLGSVLLILYILILMYAIGFMTIASGARKLAAIEKVK